jgi:CBS domain-containing protein
MNVEHIMTKNPITCERGAPCAEVAQQMRDKNVGSVIVLERGRVAGIVTDRQLAINCLAEGHDGDQTVEHVMTEDPACCTLDDNVFSVIDTFRSAGMVRRVPVVNEDRQLLGVVSLSDVAVIGKDILDAILMDETHHALNEAHIMTGGKRVVKKIRRPTKTQRLPRSQPVRVTRRATPPGLPPKSGGAGRPQGRRGAGRSTSTTNRRATTTNTRTNRSNTARRPSIGERLRRVMGAGER